MYVDVDVASPHIWVFFDFLVPHSSPCHPWCSCPWGKAAAATCTTPWAKAIEHTPQTAQYFRNFRTTFLLLQCLVWINWYKYLSHIMCIYIYHNQARVSKCEECVEAQCRMAEVYVFVVRAFQRASSASWSHASDRLRCQWFNGEKQKCLCLLCPRSCFCTNRRMHGGKEPPNCEWWCHFLEAQIEKIENPPT